MSEDWLFSYLRRLVYGEHEDSIPDTTDLKTIDVRLSSVEKEQAEIDTRLRVLERRGDPRGIREGHVS
jgi:hypothetical protein